MIVRLLSRYAVPLIVTAGLHALVVFAMLVGWAPTPVKKEVKRPSYVQASLVQLEAQAKPVAIPQVNQPKVVDLTKKKQELERQKQQAEQKRQQEVKRKQELERKQEAERKKQAEAARLKKEQQRQAQEKAEAEKKAKQQAEQEQVRQQNEQKAFEQALVQENMRLLEESYAATAQSYISVISQRIEQNWSRPPSARNGMEAELLIKLVPTGRVVSVDVTKSSGNSLFDRSAVQAVQKAEQFPIVKEMKPEVFERYYRELNLVFRPQDLRQ